MRIRLKLIIGTLVKKGVKPILEKKPKLKVPKILRWIS